MPPIFNYYVFILGLKMELHEEAPSLDETMYPLDGSFLEVSMEETVSSETYC